MEVRQMENDKIESSEFGSEDSDFSNFSRENEGSGFYGALESALTNLDGKTKINKEYITALREGLTEGFEVFDKNMHVLEKNMKALNYNMRVLSENMMILGENIGAGFVGVHERIRILELQHSLDKSRMRKEIRCVKNLSICSRLELHLPQKYDIGGAIQFKSFTTTDSIDPYFRSVAATNSSILGTTYGKALDLINRTFDGTGNPTKFFVQVGGDHLPIPCCAVSKKDDIIMLHTTACLLSIPSEVNISSQESLVSSTEHWSFSKRCFIRDAITLENQLHRVEEKYRQKVVVIYAFNSSNKKDNMITFSSSEMDKFLAGNRKVLPNLLRVKRGKRFVFVDAEEVDLPEVSVWKKLKK